MLTGYGPGYVLLRLSNIVTMMIGNTSTHIIVSLLKAWKVTVVGIECDNATF